MVLTFVAGGVLCLHGCCLAAGSAAGTAAARRPLWRPALGGCWEYCVLGLLLAGATAGDSRLPFRRPLRWPLSLGMLLVVAAGATACVNSGGQGLDGVGTWLPYWCCFGGHAATACEKKVVEGCWLFPSTSVLLLIPDSCRARRRVGGGRAVAHDEHAGLACCRCWLVFLRPHARGAWMEGLTRRKL